MLSACGGGASDGGDSGRQASPTTGPPTASPTATASAGEAPQSVSPEPTSSASPSLGPPLTAVPESVMLQPDLETTEDASDVRAWALTYCRPDPPTPDAAAMRTRSFSGPPTTLEAGPLAYTQQVAAFPTVEDAVAAAEPLLAAAEQCRRSNDGAGPYVLDLPVGTQSGLVEFAEGGAYSLGGFFRRGNALAVVQGQGGAADAVVRSALRETFDAMCVYDRPDAC